MSPTENPAADYILSCSYASAMLFQLFLPCYFGNEIIIKNSLIQNEMFASQWTAESKLFKKNMIIFCENLNKPTKITAGRRFDLSLSTFTSVS